MRHQEQVVVKTALLFQQSQNNQSHTNKHVTDVCADTDEDDNYDKVC